MNLKEKKLRDIIAEYYPGLPVLVEKRENEYRQYRAFRIILPRKKFSHRILAKIWKFITRHQDY